MTEGGAAGGGAAADAPQRRKRHFRPGMQVRCQTGGCTTIMSPGVNGVRSSNLRYRCAFAPPRARICP